MKRTILSLLITLYCLHSFSSPANAILGDESFKFFFGKYLDAYTSETLRISTHLRYVEMYLRYVSTSHLSEEMKQSRFHLLDLLQRYRMEEKFPGNDDFHRVRRPCFIDRNGNICAVGYLIEQTADRTLAEKINSKYQYAYIMDMQDMPELAEWINHSGLTLLECAMIQPEYADSNDGREFVAESQLSRQDLTSFLNENISLPDSFLLNEPEILKLNFSINASGFVTEVKFQKDYPVEFQQSVVRTFKKLHFKPAYKMHYLPEEKRYENENIASKETMFLVMHRNPNEETFIRQRFNLIISERESYFGEGVISNLIELYARRQSSDSIKINGLVTDLQVVYYPDVTKALIYGMDGSGYEILVDEIYMQENKFLTSVYNKNYASLKLEFRNKQNEIRYIIRDVKPLTQTMIMTLNNSKNNHLVCGGACRETYPDTKKAWYAPITVGLSNKNE